MARTRRTTVRWWRWRRNPLKRRSDVIEAWVVLAAWVLAVSVAVLAGLVTTGAVGRDLDRERAERQEVSAVVTKDAADATPSAREARPPQAWATVRWTAPDGSTHTHRTQVPSGTRAGTHVVVWTDRHNNLASEPLAPADAIFRATLVGGLVAIGAGGAVWGCGRITRGCLARQRLRHWDEEWERIDTRRGGKTG
ncbi:hypothetical protein [Streptomyces sp. NPDC001401]|uniref:Rv1733c family protein n=1 Tax=Streptomyces sp. NPDC001401 TaxID=3364570 RepID=UPI00368183A1